MAKAIDWSQIDTVLLDMDGVLLDLRYDNWFWREHIPERYAHRHRISVDEARSRVYPKMHAVRGTIDWYCVEYWSDTLELDIVELKTKTAHRLRVRPKVAEFLASVRKVKGAVHLVTNAHRKTIGVKFAWTGLGDFFDDVVSSHDYGIPKEETAFWVELFSRHQFDPARTLFVDDNPEVLRSARAFGIGHLRAIAQPDSGAPGTDFGEFHPIRSFEEIMP